ncbi:hypothetical protein EV193_11982 [Herbihabitans rhizosphaerae]|uniref:Glycosyltransferase A (GT-A) superfamily protein (DUF2064 family) n=1 Tax=Herbihabitans rhizosphaerae TaxID=1872711 RepID=A0A4Q7KB36_9PSEU|nr:DUF2064 domain-containing protein [Herbihabitans rhizosphaerae]RZS29677.1 hypothetical protein EV193_11982 [Herbihabitans rhizosphaerae]
MRFAVLVVAKAPVAGLAKTRLCPPATPDQAAEIAATALLDTLDAALSTPDSQTVVALTGDLGAAQRKYELAGWLARTTVIDQRGDRFGERLANAHADTMALLPDTPVVQIGMDTPQVTPALLTGAADALAEAPAVLGHAEDGGWWALGLRCPADARVLARIPMSTPDTGRHTEWALRTALGEVRRLPVLSDVDTMTDAVAVARLTGGRFAEAVAAVAGVRAGVVAR